MWLAEMARILFVCSENRLQSPTAEAIFSKCAGERDFLRLLKRENLPADILEQRAITESSGVA